MHGAMSWRGQHPQLSRADLSHKSLNVCRSGAAPAAVNMHRKARARIARAGDR